MIDDSGTLHVAWVDGAGAWAGPMPIGAVGLFPPGAPVAASNQFGIAIQTDVFAVDRNGALNVAWVDGAGAWAGSVPITRPGLFPPGAAVAASNQCGIGNQTDVFAVDRNGALNVAWVVDGGAWAGPVPISPPGLFPPGAALTASNQFGIGNQTDVFAIDRNGALNVAWVVGRGAWAGPAAIGANGVFPPGAAIAASNQFGIGDQTDVFAIDRNGAINVAWVGGAGAWSGPMAISAPNLFPPGTAVTASNQFGIPDQTDVFAVDYNGTLQVLGVLGAGAWDGPVPIVPHPQFRGQPGMTGIRK